MSPNQASLNKATEEKVLTYLAAVIYDQKPKQLALERGLTLTPFPPEVIDVEDPAALSACLSVDFDNTDPAPSNGNHLAPGSGKIISYYDKMLIFI